MYYWQCVPGSEPLVLVHGFTGQAQSWDAVVAHLNLDRTVLGVHLPGHHPNHPPLAAGFEAVVEHLAVLLQALGGQRMHLAGYSLGARISLGLVVRYPHLFQRVTLIGVHPGLATAAERAERWGSDTQWAEMLRHRGITAFIDAWESQALFASQACISTPALTAQRQLRLSHDPHALAQALLCTSLAVMPNYWPALSSIDTPVQLIVGGLDRKFCRLADQMMTQLPSARLATIAHCGHNVLLEAPELVATYLT